jgi:hypothetical protein
MATIAENIANLEAALAQGARRVRIDGKEVEYNGPTELERALAYFKAQQRQAAGRGAVGVSVGSMFRD